MRALLPTLLALGLAFAPGCGGGVEVESAPVAPKAITSGGAAAGTVGAAGAATASTSGLAPEAPNWVPLFRRVNRAPRETAYRGVRRVEQRWRVDGRAQKLEYREDVASDGVGRFAVEPLEVLQPAMNPGQASVFLAVQAARAGFVMRYRDFAVRDVGAFLTNYTVADTGALTVVAGRTCNEYLVQRAVGPQVRYWIAIDPQTALVLRTRHESANGDLLGLVEFESLETAAPRFDGVLWHAPVTDEAPLAADPHEARKQLGFEPRLLRDDGAGFVLDSASIVKVNDPNLGVMRSWAKHALTDGVEVVFLLHGGPTTAAGRDDIVTVAPSVGPWNTAEGRLRGEEFSAMGRVPVETLLDLLAATL